MPEDFRQQQKYDDRYFKRNESLRDRFNEVEIGGFMKLLNMKPFSQWEDDTVGHYKVGTAAYEDQSQQTDPYFHMLAEVERKSLERTQAYAFRRGSEIKIVPDAKKAPKFSRQ